MGRRLSSEEIKERKDAEERRKYAKSVVGNKKESRGSEFFSMPKEERMKFYEMNCYPWRFGGVDVGGMEYKGEDVDRVAAKLERYLFECGEVATRTLSIGKARKH
jgi:hypothetical protein